MTHLNIQQGLNIEVVSTNLIKKLYEAALSVPEPLEGELDAAYMSGNLLVDKSYRALVEYLTNRFDNLHINVTNDYYIPFEDSALLQLLMSGGFSTDGVGITLTDAANATFTSNTFSGNTDITSFPEFNLFTKANDSNLQNNLFSNCTNLTSINLSNCTYISSGCFKSCINLHLDVSTLSKSITAIKGESFAGGLSYVTGVLDLPNLITIGNRAFLNANITGIKCLGKSNLTNDGCFQQNSAANKLLYAYIPFECTTIGVDMFRNLTGLTTIKQYTDSVDDWVEGLTPAYTNISRVTTFEGGCFRGCSSLSLTNADITNATSIGNYAFNGVYISGNITLNNLNTIGSGAFGSAPITSLDLSGSTINNVGVSICNNNSSLISVKLPKTVTTYGRTMSASPFTDCNNITTFTGFEGITVLNNFQPGIHINNTIPLLSLETSKTFIFKAGDSGGSCSAPLVYLPKFKYSTISEFTSYYNLHIHSSFFSYRSTNSNHVFNTNLMYFKDLEKIQLAMFFRTSISNLVINKATPPTFDTNVTIDTSITILAQENWDTKIFGNISTSAMTIYVPNSAVSTYQADPNYNSYTILGIGSLNGGVIYATEDDWVAANKPNGLIAEYLGLDDTTIINNNKTELDLFIDNNNLTRWTNPNT